MRNSYLFPLSQSLPSGTQSSHTPHPPKMGGGGGAPYLIAITNCTTISSFNDTYPFSIHPEIEYPHDFNITLQIISPLSHFSLCCPLITPYHHHRSDHQSLSDPNSSGSLSFSSNTTTNPCQFLPTIKMFLLKTHQAILYKPTYKDIILQNSTISTLPLANITHMASGCYGQSAVGGLNDYSLAIMVNINVTNTCLQACKLHSPQIKTSLQLFSVNLT